MTRQVLRALLLLLTMLWSVIGGLLTYALFSGPPSVVGFWGLFAAFGMALVAAHAHLTLGKR